MFVNDALGPTGPKKKDKFKLQIDLIPPEAIISLASVFTYGAGKYGKHNWTIAPGIQSTRLYNATIRHMLNWIRGIDIDKESNIPHLDLALASLAMLIATLQRHKQSDNRLISRNKTNEEFDFDNFIPPNVDEI